MNAWQAVFRKGIAPVLGTKCLEALAKGLREDDPHLIQGSTTDPPPLQCVEDWEVEGACGIAYAHWKGSNLETVGAVESEFARTCFEAGRVLGDPASVRYFLNFFDETPREQMRLLLLAEVAQVLAERKVP